MSENKENLIDCINDKCEFPNDIDREAECKFVDYNCESCMYYNEDV